MSSLFSSTKNNKTVTYFYATFTTESKRITASAVCLFTMDQIMNSFHGNYKSKSFGQQNEHKLKNRPYNEEQHEAVPKPRPSQCPNKLTYHHLIFSRKNVLMEKEIISEALIVESTEKSRFSSIDVEYEVDRREDNKITNDVLFVGTDEGKVLKFVIQTNSENLTQSTMVFAEKMEIFKNNQIIKTSENEIFNIKLYEKSHLVLVTQNRVLSFPVENFCEKQSKTTCENHLNPYCEWKLSKCFYYRNIPNSNISATTNSVTLPSKKITNFVIEEKFLKEKNSSQIKNNEITISMNLVLFLAIMFSFFILSFVILILFVLQIYQKVYKPLKKPIENLSIVKKSSPFHFVSVGLTNMGEYQEHPSPCQTASPQSSSQSLNTTTKSSNVSSIYNPTFQNSSTHSMENYKQIQFLSQNYEKKTNDEKIQQTNNLGAYQTLLHPKNNLNIYTSKNNLDLTNFKNDLGNLNYKKDYESYLRNSEENFTDVNGFKKYYV